MLEWQSLEVGKKVFGFLMDLWFSERDGDWRRLIGSRTMEVDRRPSGDTKSRHVGFNDRLSEAQHRIANNLALIAGYTRLQATSVDRAGGGLDARDVAILLEEVAARIETVGSLHRTLSDAPAAEAVDLGQHLAAICASLSQTLSFAGEVTFSHRYQAGCLVRPDQATPLALIVSELVTNALKYAHPTGVAGRITVGCRMEGPGRLVVEVADDGVGLSEGFDPATGGGLGFRVIRGLARQLRARLSFESEGVGLIVRVSLPTDADDGEPRVVPLRPER